MNRVAAHLPARHSSSSEAITVEPDRLRTFIDDVGLVVRSTDDEHEITKRVAKQLVDGVRGLGRGLANPGAFARDVGRRRHLLGTAPREALLKCAATCSRGRRLSRWHAISLSDSDANL
jgi:hypothetical protein